MQCAETAQFHSSLLPSWNRTLRREIAGMKINCFIWLNYTNIEQKASSKNFEVIFSVSRHFFASPRAELFSALLLIGLVSWQKCVFPALGWCFRAPAHYLWR